jgi:transcriptional regulator with XRE-family HTH domain
MARIMENALKPTMMDVAARAGVSQATVSLILNGSSGARFSEATRKKVMDAVNELGYRLPNRSIAMDPSDSSVIAFITDELTTDPWMSLAFEGAREKRSNWALSSLSAFSEPARIRTKTCFRCASGNRCWATFSAPS